MAEKLGKNPWFYIFINPKQVIRTICNYEPRKGLLLLSSITALHYFFLYLTFHPIYFTRYLFIILPVILLLSPFLGWAWLHFQSWTLLVTGKIFQGKASKKELLVAVAWSKIPFLITLFLWVILLTFSWSPFFRYYFSGISLVLVSFISIISYIWSITLYVLAVEEVQKLSVLKSCANIFMAFLLMAFITTIFLFVYYYLLRLFI